MTTSSAPEPGGTKTKAAIVYNPKAGKRRGEATALLAQRELRARGLEADIHPTHGPRHATALANALVAQHDIIVAVGGDGTINEVVNGMAQAAQKSAAAGEGWPICRLGIVPAGTVNVLALELNIPRDTRGACATIAAGRERPLDLGRIDDHRFVLMAGAGLDALTIRNIDPRAKRLVKSLAFAVTGFRQALTHRPRQFRVKIDGAEHRATFMVAGNCRYYAARLSMTPGADPSDGLLDVLLFHGTTRRAVVGFWAALLVRLHIRRRDVTYLQAQRVELSPLDDGPPVWSQTDGEIVGEIPATVEVEPHAIEVLVP